MRNEAVFDLEKVRLSTCTRSSPLLYFALIFTGLYMRRPKGIKTKKSVAKRFKITATGKVLRPRAGKRHLLSSKGPKRRRSLGTAKLVDETDAYRIKQNLPFTR